ncbi:MAG: OmcA/MtrC family decaheme c-type cytochrome [Gammaproteobacteria bacterium]|nr:OmcA/MtrC family decaheme c-type cytochrome [Gammaproteobacteria bacterium]
MNRCSKLWLHSKKLVMGLLLISVISLIAACSGDDGAPGAPGEDGLVRTTIADSLDIKIDSVTISSPPVVELTVKDQNGIPLAGLTTSNLRFNIAKLIPGTDGNPSAWQNYINREKTAASGSPGDGTTALQGTYENNGTLEDMGNGKFKYTFATDITDPNSTVGNISYAPGLTHRVAIQVSGFPAANPTCDFVPANGTACITDPANIFSREIVSIDNCNECHSALAMHGGGRVETKYCVTCHNPGSTDPSSGNTVDMKVMIHKLHRGENLPSVVLGPDLIAGTADDGTGTYAIYGYRDAIADFSDVVFPQDIRNCTKCHNASNPDTPQGDNWQVPNMAACGSCHDDKSFAVDGSGCYPDDTATSCTALAKTGHPGGIITDNSLCVTCHTTSGQAGSVAESHTIPGKAERELFKYNILEICGTAVGSNPVCPPDTNPGMLFSVTDPSGATTHQYGNAYNIRSTSTDPAFSTGGGVARLFALVAWNTNDYTNDGSGNPPGIPISIDLRTSTDVTDNGDGTFLLTSSTKIPASATGSGTVAIEGHPAAMDKAGAYTVRVPVNSEVAYFAITDTIPQARRQVVDVPTKCDNCHDSLNVHGNNRNNNGQLCVLCHNSSNTDVNQRPKDGTTGLPDATATTDGKTEESIDFKRMIHAIHAAAADAHGFRNKEIVVYGYGGSANPFGHVRFPGVLAKCDTCHLEVGELGGTVKYDTYVLADHTADGGVNWEWPAMSGIRGSTVNSYPTAAADGSDFAAKLADQTEDWKYSPIASVCSACHDGDVSAAHMKDNGAIMGGAGSEQSVQAGNIESCPVCHGSGKIADVELVHNEAFANFLGEFVQ